MAIVVVGGSTKDIGKTALVCAIISALPDFNWTAVKITGHSYELGPFLSRLAAEDSDPTVWEEMNPGQETDTARYLAAGARRALLVTRCGPEIPIDEIQRRAQRRSQHHLRVESDHRCDRARCVHCPFERRSYGVEAQLHSTVAQGGCARMRVSRRYRGAGVSLWAPAFPFAIAGSAVA